MGLVVLTKWLSSSLVPPLFGLDFPEEDRSEGKTRERVSGFSVSSFFNLVLRSPSIVYPMRHLYFLYTPETLFTDPSDEYRLTEF